jgi:hypothetical protein
LSLKEIQVDRSPFPINKLDLENPGVLIRLEQADTTKGKNVVISDPRSENDVKPTPSRKVVMEKLPNGEETITITIGGSTMGNQEREAEGSTSARNEAKWKPIAINQEQAVRPPPGWSNCHDRPKPATQSHGHTPPRVGPTTTKDGPTAPKAGQTASHQNRAPRMVKPQIPKSGEWGVNEGRNMKLVFKPTFDYLLNKYTKAGPKDRTMKRLRSPIRKERRE